MSVTLSSHFLTYSDLVDCEMRDLKVGIKFFYSTYSGTPRVLRKMEDVGDSGSGWAYCEDIKTGKLIKVMWNQPVRLI